VGNFFGGYCALAVAFGTKQTSFFRPSAVAVHYYRDMARHFFGFYTQPRGGLCKPVIH
jgi:hypothetical protein